MRVGVLLFMKSSILLKKLAFYQSVHFSHTHEEKKNASRITRFIHARLYKNLFLIIIREDDESFL